MANKKTLKHNINCVCSELFAECLTAYVTVQKEDEEQIDAILSSILELQKDYAARAAHPEPGMKPSQYYNALIEDFNKQVSEIVGNIQALA